MFSKEKRSVGMLLRRMLAVLSVAFLMLALTGCVTADGTASGGTSASADASVNGMNGITTIVWLAAILLVFYFLMIRPEKKKRKQAEELRNSLSVGDEITTIGGMVGKIVDVNDKFLTFETGEDRVRIQVAKWAVSTTGKAADPEQK